MAGYVRRATNRRTTGRQSIGAPLTILLALAIAYACSSDDSPAGPESGPAEPDAIEAVSGDGQTGMAGATLTEPIVVEVVDRQGDPVSDVSVAWDVATGGGTVASATTNTGADGRASVAWTLGTTVGENELEAAVDELPTVTYTATAEPATPATLELSPASAAIPAVDDTVRFNAVTSDEYGNTIPDAAPEWSSADTDVVTIDEAGLVRAEAAGETEIVAATADGSVADTAVVTVDQHAASVSISPADVILTATDDTVRLDIDAEDANGNPVADAGATWTTSDEAVVTVSASGLLTAASGGTAEVTATVDTASASLTVAVSTASGAARDWIGGHTDEPDGWGNPRNWSPAGSPNARDTTVIRADVEAGPILDADASVGRIEVRDEAELDIGAHVLTANGSVDAQGSIAGTGTLVLSGTGATVAGNVPGLLVTASLSLGGPTTVGGAIRIAGGALDLNAFPLSIATP